MKKIILLLTIVFTTKANAQSIAINSTGTSANSTSILDVSSTNKGLLIPRMSSVQRTGISTPANGLLVYDNDSLAFAYYNGVDWSFIKGNNNIATAWSTKGNTGTTSANFMGTIDNQDVIFKRWNVKAGLLSFTNTAFGYNSFVANTTGSFNSAFGVDALISNTTGNSNVAIGSSALYKNTNRSNLVGIGDSALFNNGIGASNTEAIKNTALGSKALYNNTRGYGNTALGFNALYSSTTAYDNIAIGNEAMYLTNNNNNIGIGNRVLLRSIGVGNIAMGNDAGQNFSTNSNYNVLIGDSAARLVTSGSRNVIIGAKSLFTGFEVNDNVIIGHNAGPSGIGIGNNNNVVIGSGAGLNVINGAGNTLIGNNTDLNVNNFSNATAIGNNALVGASNSMVLGSINGINGAVADTKVGIGVTNPTEKLEIGNGRLRFKGNMTSGNAHGITWTNNAGTTDRAFIGMETDDLFGIFNFGLSNWNVRVHNTSGEVGIFKQPLTANIDSRLQIKQKGLQNGIGIESASNTSHWDMYLDNNATPDFNFYFNGTLKSYIRNSDGAYIQVSDKNLKKDITALQSSLQKINTLVPYQYHYLDNSNSDNYSIGFIAQDVQKIYPDAVSEKVLKDGKTQLGANYQYFTVLAIKGLQEQQMNIETQNKKIEILENQITELKKMVEQQIKK
jgi:trimeric autotransporter adhesin